MKSQRTHWGGAATGRGRQARELKEITVGYRDDGIGHNDVRDALINVQRKLSQEKGDEVEYLKREELFDNFYGPKQSRSPSKKRNLGKSKHTASLERFEELETNRQKKLEAKRLEKLLHEEASMSEVPLVNSNMKVKSQYKNSNKQHSKPGVVSRAKQLELENIRNCTFKPNLSATRKRAPGGRSREGSEDPTVSDFYEEKGRTPSQLLEWGQEKESKLAQLRLAHANDENVITQSVPNINLKSKLLVLPPLTSPGERKICASARTSE